MNLWSPSGVVPATRVANQLTITASQAAIPQIPAQISWGTARTPRRATGFRPRGRVIGDHVAEARALRLLRGAQVPSGRRRQDVSDPTPVVCHPRRPTEGTPPRPE